MQHIQAHYTDIPRYFVADIRTNIFPKFFKQKRWLESTNKSQGEAIFPDKYCFRFSVVWWQPSENRIDEKNFFPNGWATCCSPMAHHYQITENSHWPNPLLQINPKRIPVKFYLAVCICIIFFIQRFFSKQLDFQSPNCMIVPHYYIHSLHQTNDNTLLSLAHNKN